MNWKNMSFKNKVATVISCIAVVVWLIPKLQPELLSIDPTYPAIAVFTACEAAIYWDSKRKWSYLLIAGAVISMICFIL